MQGDARELSDEAARALAALKWRVAGAPVGVLPVQREALLAMADGVVVADVHEVGPAAVRGGFLHQ